LTGFEISYELFDQEFSVKNGPPISRGRNFHASNPFLPIFSATDALKKGLQLLFGHYEQ
jgi:hypothetical protein